MRDLTAERNQRLFYNGPYDPQHYSSPRPREDAGRGAACAGAVSRAGSDARPRLRGWGCLRVPAGSSARHGRVSRSTATAGVRSSGRSVRRRCGMGHRPQARCQGCARHRRLDQRRPVLHDRDQWIAGHSREVRRTRRETWDRRLATSRRKAFCHCGRAL